MKAVDTNILVRFLVGDDEAQAEIVYRIFKNAESDKKQLFIPLLVVLELIWVLESVYDISRKEIIDAINGLTLMPVLKLESVPTLQRFTRYALATDNDLPDLLIACSAAIQGCESVITFDKKASRFTLFEPAT
jgi:predicted nucleic-acid-binding protein